jgi:hypothetical protein
MTPTQAQIDVARVQLMKWGALWWGTIPDECISAMLTAAAQAGEQELKNAILDRNAHLQRAERAIKERDEMKERCAQVVKEWIEKNGASQHGRSLYTLLECIRALKDKT